MDFQQLVSNQRKFEFDDCANDQPSMMEEVDKLDTMVHPVCQEKTASFTTLIPHIDFVIPNEFNDAVECKISLSSILPKVIPELKHVSSAKILILPHFKTRGRVFSNQGRMTWKA